MVISVVLVDDHAVVRDGLRALLELQVDIAVVGSFGEADQAVRFCGAAHADVVVLDIALPGASGIDAVKQVQDACVDAKVLMLSMHSGSEYVARALRAGANGYVVKESAGDEMVLAVRTVHAGERFLSRKISLEELAEAMRRGVPEDPLERLTLRERQVLKLVVEGHSSNEIAAQLRLSSRSVDTYRSRMMSKLHVEDLATLVKFAVRRGITSID
ncbi:MAG: response regulator [Betaproteobacteria bacterium]